MDNTFNLNNPIDFKNPISNPDVRYGVYNSKEEALEALKFEVLSDGSINTIRAIGRTVLINEESGQQEYWFEGGISDEYLVPKGTNKKEIKKLTEDKLDIDFNNAKYKKDFLSNTDKYKEVLVVNKEDGKVEKVSINDFLKHNSQSITTKNDESPIDLYEVYVTDDEGVLYRLYLDNWFLLKQDTKDILLGDGSTLDLLDAFNKIKENYLPKLTGLMIPIERDLLNSEGEIDLDSFVDTNVYYLDNSIDQVMKGISEYDGTFDTFLILTVIRQADENILQELRLYSNEGEPIIAYRFGEDVGSGIWNWGNWKKVGKNISNSDQIISSGLVRKLGVEGARLDITGLEEKEANDVSFSHKMVMNDDGTLAKKVDNPPLNVTFPSRINVSHSHFEIKGKGEVWEEEIIEQVKKVREGTYVDYDMNGKVETFTYNGIEPTASRVNGNKIIAQYRRGFNNTDTGNYKAITSLELPKGDFVIRANNVKNGELFSSAGMSIEIDDISIGYVEGEGRNWSLSNNNGNKYISSNGGVYDFYLMKTGSLVTLVFVSTTQPKAGLEVFDIGEQTFNKIVLKLKIKDSGDYLELDKIQIKEL